MNDDNPEWQEQDFARAKLAGELSKMWTGLVNSRVTREYQSLKLRADRAAMRCLRDE